VEGGRTSAQTFAAVSSLSLRDKSDEPWICRRCANSPRNFLVLLRMFQNPCPWGRKHNQRVKSNASPSTKETAGTCLPSISRDVSDTISCCFDQHLMPCRAMQGLGISPRLAIDPVAAAILARVPLWQQSLGNFENSVHESLRFYERTLGELGEPWWEHKQGISAAATHFQLQKIFQDIRALHKLLGCLLLHRTECWICVSPHFLESIWCGSLCHLHLLQGETTRVLKGGR
jgi:hypothetical protein